VAKLVPLSCPFCGSIPKVLPDNPEDEGSAWGEVRCVNRGCAVQPRCMDGATVADDRGSAAYKRLAIRRWNTRKESRRG
jgi:hypothetical protein